MGLLEAYKKYFGERPKLLKERGALYSRAPVRGK
jgi:hypothetical protein